MSVGKTENNFPYIVPHRLRGRRTEIKENSLTKLASENRSEKRVRQKSTWVTIDVRRKMTGSISKEDGFVDFGPDI